MLHLYYTNLEKKIDKLKFIQLIGEKCKVSYPTVRSWISKPEISNHRNPKPIYRTIISEIAGVPENTLFEEED